MQDVFFTTPNTPRNAFHFLVGCFLLGITAVETLNDRNQGAVGAEGGSQNMRSMNDGVCNGRPLQDLIPVS